MIRVNRPASTAAALPANASRRSATAAALPRDAYRSLLRKLSAAGPGEHPPRTIGVTSCRPGEGVSTTMVNLAVQAVQDYGEPVLVIDLSPAQQALRWLGGRADAEGLSDVLLKNSELGNCLQFGTQPAIGLLCAGKRCGELNAGLDRQRIETLLEKVRQRFRYVLVDLPPADELGAFVSLAQALDGVLWVVEAERTRGPLARHVRQQLQQANVNLLGVVFNKRRDHVPGWLYRRL